MKQIRCRFFIFVKSDKPATGNNGLMLQFALIVLSAFYIFKYI